MLHSELTKTNEKLEQKVKARTEELNKTLKILSEKEENLRLILNSIQDFGILKLDKEGKIISWNPGAEKLTGYTSEEISGKYFSIFFTEDEREKGFPEKEIKIALLEGKCEVEGIRLKKNGTPFWSISTLYVYKEENEKVNGFVKIIRDITERKEKEELLEIQSKKLKEVNDELESFSYSVSHDLRAPLRHIDGFSKLLSKAQNELTNENKLYLSYITESVSKMGKLIDNLLAFSRISKDEIKKTKVDLNKIVAEVIFELKTEIEDRNINWKITDLPVVEADHAMMKQVYLNLLSNAIKFTQKKEDPNIEVSFNNDNGKKIFCVKDNGAGFDMKYIDKVFGIFQRLHTNKEFEGTGIGLANVKRIITKHGGKVWAEGEVNKGASIYFTLISKGF